MNDRSLAGSLFQGTDYKPEVVSTFAEGIVRLMVIRALAWAAVTILNFGFGIVIPLYLLATGQRQFLGILIPAAVLAVILAAAAPTGTKPDRTQLKRSSK